VSQVEVKDADHDDVEDEHGVEVVLKVVDRHEQ